MKPTRTILQQTHVLIKDHIHRTPLLSSSWLTRKIACNQLHFKAENYQKAGAFKARGACNAVMNTSSVKVCTNSSGNHGAALAFMAHMCRKEAIIVMPENSSKVKVDAVKGFHGIIRYCKNSVEDREATTKAVAQEAGAHIIHPYNDWHVIGGQATCAMEIYEDLAELDYLIVPIGGGGLCSGSILATTEFSPRTKVIGVEPELASDAKQSLYMGSIQPQMPPITIADGLRTSLGDKTFPIIRESIHDIITVSEEEIIRATFQMQRALKIFAETSSATVLAALLKTPSIFQGKRIACIISGGNVDLKPLVRHTSIYDECMT